MSSFDHIADAQVFHGFSQAIHQQGCFVSHEWMPCTQAPRILALLLSYGSHMIAAKQGLPASLKRSLMHSAVRWMAITPIMVVKRPPDMCIQRLPVNAEAEDRSCGGRRQPDHSGFTIFSCQSERLVARGWQQRQHRQHP